MKNIKILVLLAIVTISCVSNGNKEFTDGVYAEIETNKGTILLELYAKDVPMTVANFVALSEGTNSKLTDSLKNKNFYEGIIFHRVVNNFVIQAGGYTATGTKKLGYNFGDEFPKNKEGGLLYSHNDAGILSMANAGPGTNNTQFFITHKPVPHLDGKHTVFGKVILHPKELKVLKNKILDSLQLKTAIDSTRMSVVNAIKQGDTIKTVRILKAGSLATSFTANEVFNNELLNFAENEKIIKQEKEKAEKVRYEKYLVAKKAFLLKMNESKSVKTASGLRILKLKETSGKKVVDTKKITSHFTLYTANGTKIQSSLDKGMRPFVFKLNDPNKPMISGFKEGVLQMREGEKARLFIPYYIAYGEEAFGPFPKKADLVFDIEILKIEE